MVIPKNPYVLPEWIVINKKLNKGEKLTPLEEFIYEQEPVGNMDEKRFQNGLRNAIEFVLVEKGEM